MLIISNQKNIFHVSLRYVPPHGRTYRRLLGVDFVIIIIITLAPAYVFYQRILKIIRLSCTHKQTDMCILIK